MMSVFDKLEPISECHPDAEQLALFQRLVDGLFMYSEDKQPYEVFLWDVEIHGSLLNEYSDFNFMDVVEKLHDRRMPILRTSLLQSKHRDFFEFEGDKLKNRQPSKFYRTKYDAWNRFLGRIYTDNGALSTEEINQMRTFAKHVWELEPNSVRVFEFDSPAIQQYLMGQTPSGNWIGVHTVSVET